MNTRQRILQLVRDEARTPMAIIRELEKERRARPDGRSMLLRLISEGIVDFGVDGKVRLPQGAPATGPSARVTA